MKIYQWYIRNPVEMVVMVVSTDLESAIKLALKRNQGSDFSEEDLRNEENEVIITSPEDFIYIDYIWD